MRAGAAWCSGPGQGEGFLCAALRGRTCLARDARAAQSARSAASNPGAAQRVGRGSSGPPLLSVPMERCLTCVSCARAWDWHGGMACVAGATGGRRQPSRSLRGTFVAGTSRLLLTSVMSIPAHGISGAEYPSSIHVSSCRQAPAMYCSKACCSAGVHLRTSDDVDCKATAHWS